MIMILRSKRKRNPPSEKAMYVITWTHRQKGHRRQTLEGCNYDRTSRMSWYLQKQQKGHRLFRRASVHMASRHFDFRLLVPTTIK